MAKNQRTFADGINEMNGYVINVIRFVGAQQISNTSRIAAHYWGTITKPDGTEIGMGDNGMTVTDIKKIVSGMTTRSYNRSGESSEIKKLEAIKSQLQSLGMSTAEVDGKIEAKKAEIEAAKAADALREVNKSRIKALNKDLKKLSEIRSSMESVGVDTTEICAKMNAIEEEIASLS
jgi:hypothetical protein